MRKKLLGAFVGICASMMALTVYGSEEFVDTDIDITFDAYEMGGGLLSVEESDGEGGTMISEYGSAGYIASSAGIKISEMLEEMYVASIEPVNENDVFEGWMEYEIIVTVDEDGFGWETYENVSGDKLYTTEELMELEVPDHDVMYVAKWESIPVEEYFAEVEEEVVVAEASLTLDANGGTIHFDAEEPYDSDFGVYTLEVGQEIQEVLNDGPITSVEKDGAEFTGWTIYTGDTITMEEAETDEEGTMCFPFTEDLYIIITNCEVYSELADTEELGEIISEETNYYVIANWK